MKQWEYWKEKEPGKMLKVRHVRERIQHPLHKLSYSDFTEVLDYRCRCD